MANKPLVFISPHLDDVILSCGGLIHHLGALGLQIHVMTIFAGNPSSELSSFAAWMHQAWQLPLDAPAHRRQEDLTAVSLLGARAIHLSFQDCIYRQDPTTTQQFLYTSPAAMFAGDYGKEHALVSEIIKALKKQLTAQDYALIFAPLGIGHHMDHLLTRKAVENMDPKSIKKRMVFYEDFPYALKRYPFDDPISQSQINQMHSQVYLLGEQDVQAKEHAITLYNSQMQKAGNAMGIQIAQVRQYASLVCGEVSGQYGERYWSSEYAPLNQLDDLRNKN